VGSFVLGICTSLEATQFRASLSAKVIGKEGRCQKRLDFKVFHPNDRSISGNARLLGGWMMRGVVCRDIRRILRIAHVGLAGKNKFP
jgi:hypothetical protein